MEFSTSAFAGRRGAPVFGRTTVSSIMTNKSGGPAGIRTLDTRIKSPMLCQAELQAHADGVVRPMCRAREKRMVNSKWTRAAFQG